MLRERTQGARPARRARMGGGRHRKGIIMTRTDFIMKNGKELDEHWNVQKWLKGRGMREVIYSIIAERDNERRLADRDIADCAMRYWLARLAREINAFYENDYGKNDETARVEAVGHELQGMKSVYESLTGTEWKEHTHDQLIDWLNACAYECRWWRELDNRAWDAE